MQMQEWVKLLTGGGALGVIAVVLVALAIFVYKKLWPMIEARIAHSDKRAELLEQRAVEQEARFTATIHQLMSLHSQDTDKLASTLQQMARANERALDK